MHMHYKVRGKVLSDLLVLSDLWGCQKRDLSQKNSAPGGGNQQLALFRKKERKSLYIVKIATRNLQEVKSIHFAAQWQNLYKNQINLKNQLWKIILLPENVRCQYEEEI